MAQNPKARLYVAEDVRREIDGKLSLIGLFADGVVIAAGAEGQDVVLRSLTFLVTLTDFPDDRESVEFSADLITPTGTVGLKSTPQQIANPGPGRSVNIVMPFAPITFKNSGKRAVRVHLDDISVDLEYEFRLQRPPGVEAASKKSKPRRAAPAKLKKNRAS
jgi:hypothetical protein